MGVKQSLNLSDTVSFVMGIDGEIHLASVFGDTWCQDMYDEENDDYIDHVELDGPAGEPEDESSLCRMCLQAARDEQG